MRPCTHQVKFGNGEVQTLEGEVTLKVMIQGKPYKMPAYVLTGKGPPLIMGFSFLEMNNLLVDCTNRVLLGKDREPVRCMPMGECWQLVM